MTRITSDRTQDITLPTDPNTTTLATAEASAPPPDTAEASRPRTPSAAPASAQHFQAIAPRGPRPQSATRDIDFAAYQALPEAARLTLLTGFDIGPSRRLSELSGQSLRYAISQRYPSQHGRVVAAARVADETIRALGIAPATFFAMANKVYNNEVGANPANIAFFNPQETFPSLGVIHAIWLNPSNPAWEKLGGANSFGDMMRFMAEQGIELPPFVAALAPEYHCPWPASQAEFLADATAQAQAAELRAFLTDTKAAQAAYLISKNLTVPDRIRAQAAAQSQPEVAENLDRVLADPRGLFAVTDYVNFKGAGLVSGDSTSAWGLYQVLAAMDTAGEPMAAFVQAAHDVLQRTRSVTFQPNSTTSDWERFGPGWDNRLRRYLE